MFTVIAVAACAALLVIALVAPWSPFPLSRHVPAQAAEPCLLLEPRGPRDTSRPYPRPKGHRSKLNSGAALCAGPDGRRGLLRQKVLGWLGLHASCAEWLGDWHSPRPAPPLPFKPDPELIGYIEQGQRGPRSSSGALTRSSSPAKGPITVTGRGRLLMGAKDGVSSATNSTNGSVTWSAAGDRQPLACRWRCACGAIGYMEGDLAIHRRWCPGMER